MRMPSSVFSPLNNISQQARCISHHKPQLLLPARYQLVSRKTLLQATHPTCSTSRPFSSQPQPQARPSVFRHGQLATRQQLRCSSSSKMADSIESAKRAAAIQAVAENFDPNASHVGIGSGTTIVYVVEAIKEASTNPQIRFVPTGYQSRQVIVKAGLTPIAFDSLPEDVMLDIAFDGADEVDDDLNCIKGGGACLFQEKLVAQRAKKFICVADYRKAQSRLLTNWPTIPIEVAPISVHTVLHSLRTLGSTGPKVRTTLLEKSGPLKTDQDFFIIDAPFPTLLISSDVSAGKGKGDGSDGTWEVNALARAIKHLTGVLEVGIFAGLNGVQAEALRSKAEGKTVPVITGGQKPVAVYFGMQDGSVSIRKAKE